MSYQNKYLKYKNKYLNLKNQIGRGYKDLEFSEYESAGIIFTDNKHILAGYQKTRFSGIGGHKEELFDNNDAKITAIREMLEELFGIEMTRLSKHNQPIIQEEYSRLLHL